MKVIEIGEHVDAENMPLCPICDNVIIDGEPCVIGITAGVMGLCHQICVETG